MGLEKPVISGTNGGNNVKHIQRGFVSGTGLTQTNYNVSLNGFTDLSKMAVVLDGYVLDSSSERCPVFVGGLTLDTLTISHVKGGTGYFSWQVIEYE